jgi:transposase
MTKIHMFADGLGRPLSFILTAGQVHDSRTATALLEGRSADGVIADKAYDNNAVRSFIAEPGMAAVVPSKRNEKTQPPTTPQPTRHEIASNAASTSSNTSDASPRDKTDTKSISSPSSTSQRYSYG